MEPTREEIEHLTGSDPQSVEGLLEQGEIKLLTTGEDLRTIYPGTS
jgi:hypothetical protein